MNYFIKTPKILHSLYGDAVWFLPNSENKIYLTFDDGPVEGVTENCLDILKEFNIKATFFCVGENAKNRPEVLSRIVSEGHQIGNHSYSHPKGWNTENETYFEDVEKCQQFIASKFFRPPYGKAKRSQLKVLKKRYKIIMWDVLSGDFDPKNNVDTVIQNVISKTESGSIIVMHDNEKCGNKMLAALPRIIQSLLEKGFQFEIIK